MAPAITRKFATPHPRTGRFQHARFSAENERGAKLRFSPKPALRPRVAFLKTSGVPHARRFLFPLPAVIEPLRDKWAGVRIAAVTPGTFVR